MILSELQRQIIEAPEDKIIVMSAAASGKSACCAERVRFWLREGVNPKEICVITFTNNAAQELRNRLKEDYSSDLFIGTIHSLANQMLMKANVNTSNLLNNERYDELFELVEEHPECIIHYDYLILDEAQDSSPMEFNFIFNMIDPLCFFVCGDVRQAIYSFRGGDPKLLTNLSKRKDVTVYELNENYRNAPNILREAKRILSKAGMEDNSIAVKMKNGDFVRAEYSNALLIQTIRSRGELKDWYVLTRTNAQVDFIQKALNKYKIPNLTFKQGQNNLDELNELMEKDAVKVLTIHSAKGLNLPYVIVYGAWGGKKEEIRLNYVAATRAEDGLYWYTVPKKNNRF